MAERDDIPSGDDGLSPLETAFLIFRDAGLRMPPIPHHLADALLRKADAWFTNQAGGAWVTTWAEFEDRLKGGPGGDYVGFGIIGHGAASRWVAYGLQVRGLAVWLRLSTGHPGQDPVAESVANNAALMALEPRMVDILEAQDRSAFPARAGILIVHDEHADLKGVFAYRGGVPDFAHDITPMPDEPELRIARLFPVPPLPPGVPMA